MKTLGRRYSVDDINTGDLVVRRGLHEPLIYFVKYVEGDCETGLIRSILLVDGVADLHFEEDDMECFYDTFRVLAKYVHTTKEAFLNWCPLQKDSHLTNADLSTLHKGPTGDSLEQVYSYIECTPPQTTDRQRLGGNRMSKYKPVTDANQLLPLGTRVKFQEFKQGPVVTATIERVDLREDLNAGLVYYLKTGKSWLEGTWAFPWEIVAYQKGKSSRWTPVNKPRLQSVCVDDQPLEYYE